MQTDACNVFERRRTDERLTASQLESEGEKKDSAAHVFFREVKVKLRLQQTYSGGGCREQLSLEEGAERIHSRHEFSFVEESFGEGCGISLSPFTRNSHGATF